MFTAAPPRPLNLGTARYAVPPAVVPEVSPREIGADAFDRDDSFITWLFMRAGMRARHYRPCALRRRLPACLRALRAADMNQARRLLRRSERLIPAALDALLLGVTEFFRDKEVFECLEARLRAAVNDQRPLRVWSAGCSSGAELYSLAIVLAELNALKESELLGTDCRPEALARAAAGTYCDSNLTGVSVGRLHAHFQRGLVDWQVARDLREQITWRRADVLAGVEPGPWDVILCRNLAMYLEPVAAQRLWRSLASTLRPGGLLVVGKAERPPAAAWLHPVGPCVYRRYGAT